MIDLTTEAMIPLARAAEMVPPARRGKKTHLSTVFRWVTDGAKGPDGRRVRLEAVRLGGRWLTSTEAVQRFAERLTPDLDRPRPPASRSPGARERAAKRADRQLRRLGI
jgi:hypothetical protein